MDERPAPKFKVGQIVVLTSLKKAMPFRILAIEWYDGWFYAFGRRSFVAETSIRKLTEEEVG